MGANRGVVPSVTRAKPLAVSVGSASTRIPPSVGRGADENRRAAFPFDSCCTALAVRGTRIVPSVRDPDRLFAIAPRGLFSYRPTPFGGVWFAVEGGKLVIAAPDA